MIAFRSLHVNASRLSLLANNNRQILLNHHSFSANSTTSSCVSYFSTETDGFLTGTVKFFIRKKAYGFLIPDDPVEAGSSEVWVHRTSIDSPHSSDEYPTRPYLYKDERVKFRVEFDEEGRTPKATELTFENGKAVPLFRKNYHQSAIKGEQQRLGEFLLEIMKEEGLTDAEQLEKIKTAVAATQEAITAAERNQELYGPPSDDQEA
ncbi:unnamed protein product [Cylindrotheca closterium]|uniref:CSD domain-containing protein n=1 Tax=Cylindrotheca closterium TaxID=2856 RepID=A0AAD2G6A7_9STRA|nr:unnamed protein product [Cylindrotheca closterium]